MVIQASVNWHVAFGLPHHTDHSQYNITESEEKATQGTGDDPKSERSREDTSFIDTIPTLWSKEKVIRKPAVRNVVTKHARRIKMKP